MKIKNFSVRYLIAKNNALYGKFILTVELNGEEYTRVITFFPKAGKRKGA